MVKIVCRGQTSRAQIIFIACMALCLSVGCASYNKQAKYISQSWESGNFQSAAERVSAEAQKRKNTGDAVVWRLEQGAILRAAGQLEASNSAFDMAEEMIDKFEQKAKVKVAHETFATVTNQTTLPYEGFAYDKIMMNTYKALNYLELEDYEKARVELNRAYERQKDAVYLNAMRIEKAQEEGKRKNLNIDLEKVNSDSRFRSQMEGNYTDTKQFQAYTDYVNPLTVYLDALFFMTQATGSSDLERSRKSFERVIGMVGENTFISQDLKTLQQVIEGKPIPPITYIIFETGLAPEREQIRIDIPLFLIVPGVPYVGAAFPKLNYRSNYLSTLNVSHDGMIEPTTLLANMDAVITREFKNELPLIITKTLIASAIKAGATYGTYAGMTQGGRRNTEAGIAVLIAGAIYQAVMNQADLRTWTTLPNEFQFCRFTTPSDRKVELMSPYSGQKTSVTINEGIVNIVWVKSVNNGSPLLVRQFTLLKDRAKDMISPGSTTPLITDHGETYQSEQLKQISQIEASPPQIPQTESSQPMRN